DHLVPQDIHSVFSSMADYETRVATIIDDSHKNAGITDHPQPTSLNVWSWKTYRNDNFGISFKYPSDWKFLEASGDGYMNIAIGKGTDGIEINLTSLGDDASNPSFEEGFLTRI